MSDTPRTDLAELDRDGFYKGHLVWASHARQLERELNIMTAEIAELREDKERLLELFTLCPHLYFMRTINTENEPVGFSASGWTNDDAYFDEQAETIEDTIRVAIAAAKGGRT